MSIPESPEPGSTTYETDYPEIEYVVNQQQRPKRGPLARLGCGLALVTWFTLMLLPLFFFILAVQGDITLRHRGDVPDKHQHPLLQIMLLMAADARGLQLTNSTINRDVDNLCIDTTVRYLMWQGQGDDVQFCDCYSRNDTDDSWNYETTEMSACGN